MDGPGSSLETSPSASRSSELEDRRIATRRVAWIGAIAWPLFVVTDIADAMLSDRPQILLPLLCIRALGTFIALSLLFVLRTPGLSSVALSACDLGYFMSASLLVSLEAIFIGGFEPQVALGFMILAFTRAALLPSHWSRAFIVAAVSVLVFPITLGIASSLDVEVARAWLAPGKVGPVVYALVQILAGVAIGSAGSHMAWRARRQVFEARKLGNYRLKARIGSGSTGDVWLARQDPLDRDVALKVLRTSGFADDESRRRFAREAKAASSLRHPNTIRIFEFGASDDGVFFMAMELLDGVDLEQLVTRNGPLTASRAIHFALQACGSLAEAHDAGIVHRDIKPANLFVTRVGDDEDFLKLLDFGIARLVESEHAGQTTEVGVIVGTPAYMSPEACAGERVDGRSDVYSLGAVLYFMLTATEIFAGKSIRETLVAHVTHTPTPPSARLHDKGLTVPGDLEAVVMRCLEKSAEGRFESARDLEQALRECLDYDEGGRRSVRSSRPQRRTA